MVKSFKVHKVKGNGACLFNSIAFGVIKQKKGEVPSSSEYAVLSNRLRQVAVEYINKKVENYKKNESQNNLNYVTGLALDMGIKITKNDPESMYKYGKQYVKEMSKTKTWGGDHEMAALKNYMHKLNINGIKVLTTNHINFNNKEILQADEFGAKYNQKNLKYGTIHLLYSNGNHYDYLEPISTSIKVKINNEISKKIKKNTNNIEKPHIFHLLQHLLYILYYDNFKNDVKSRKYIKDIYFMQQTKIKKSEIEELYKKFRSGNKINLPNNLEKLINELK